jgi:hypothetical protein|tara:strand:+ start:212 stop:400 length:189 start_codon:yes stop_codon:yes gene_type:complete
MVNKLEDNDKKLEKKIDDIPIPQVVRSHSNPHYRSHHSDYDTTSTKYRGDWGTSWVNQIRLG